jgi:hypothetical protein
MLKSNLENKPFEEWLQTSQGLSIGADAKAFAALFAEDRLRRDYRQVLN